MLLALEKAQSGLKAVPVPQRSGEPSTIEHVVYVIKENRTYDQLFGDLPQGNGIAKLCTFGRQVTPNHHALAEEFVLLDNYYCNGVMSADGHQWATQGAVTDYQEKKMGDHPRGYFFGIDCADLRRLQFHLGQRALARPVVPQLRRARLAPQHPAAVEVVRHLCGLPKRRGQDHAQA